MSDIGSKVSVTRQPRGYSQYRAYVPSDCRSAMMSRPMISPGQGSPASSGGAKSAACSYSPTIGGRPASSQIRVSSVSGVSVSITPAAQLCSSAA